MRPQRRLFSFVGYLKCVAIFFHNGPPLEFTEKNTGNGGSLDWTGLDCTVVYILTYIPRAAYCSFFEYSMHTHMRVL